MNLNKRLLFAGSFFIFLFVSLSSYGQTEANKQAFYNALSSNSAAIWNKQMENAKSLTGNEKPAFEGALQMRKAGSLKVPAQKLSLFKQGHKQLEAAIDKEPQNPEFRFLRLMVQEHAPKVLGYNKNISDDVKLIKSNYKNLPTVTKHAILAYSSTSKNLTGLQ